MRNRLQVLTVILLLLSAHGLLGQTRHEIQIPDLPGYKTLKCDFHTHTVFSDGSVWPVVRVDEAWRQGLDAIAITDHIEYQPHKDDVPTAHNRPFELAVGAARQAGILLPRAAELTHDTPPGHFNAIFLDDITALDTDDLVEQAKRANAQGGFVFWNHQGWKGEEKGKWQDVHSILFDHKWLHGMEVCNGESYYPSAHKWCLEKNLTMLGNSDIHSPDLREASTTDGHRTMTLVFAKERTLPSLKEALDARRTAVWYMDRLIGRAEILSLLFDACIEIERPHLRQKKTIWFKIRNRCDLNITLQRTGSVGPPTIELPARSTSLVKANVDKPDEASTFSYTATNFVIAPDRGLPVSLHVAAP